MGDRKGIAEPKEDKKQDDAQASEQKIEKMEDFDPYNVKPNTEGKYVIPSRFIDYNNDDTESTDGCLMGNESDDEWQYNYEEFHDYELDDECSD
uniref:Uncharacterized protein n=1 Tax=Caenorhabditis japonica TaxID=281687 RepID=A0A8R1EJU0_CAEJA